MSARNRAPLMGCTHPGCTALVEGGGRCERHPYPPRRQNDEAKRRYDAGRPNAAARGYGYTWKKIRDAHLAREPRCVRCLRQGRVRLADMVDHIRPIAEGGGHEASNLQSLCYPCHAAKTREDIRRRRRRGASGGGPAPTP